MIQLFHMAKRTTALSEAQLYYQCPSPAICGGCFHFKKIGLSHLYARSRVLTRGGVRQIAYWPAPGQVKASSGQKWKVLLIGFSHINHLRSSETGLRCLIDIQANFSEFFSGFCGGCWLLFPLFISLTFLANYAYSAKKIFEKWAKNA